MNCTYAIISDDDERITAVFEDLEDAMDWGAARFGANRYKIRHCPMIELERAERLGATGPV